MNSESIFKTRSIIQIHDEIKSTYLSDARPWILGYSGGKDSTCMVHLVWNAISELPSEKRVKKIYIISSDTLVESPKIVEQVTTTLQAMEDAAREQHLPVSTNLVRPIIEDTFWCCLLGKGYPAPSNNFRWCTDRLKIRNADRFITEKVSEYGEAIVVLGTRKDESGSREQIMNLNEIKGSALYKHSKFAQAYIYAPLRDFITDDVWKYLLQNKSPWGANNRDLLALYQNANAQECPLVVDTNTPSCGNSRFGCWTCTVISDDSSMKSLVKNGEQWMQPLIDLRKKLKDTQDPDKKLEIREFKRRNGRVQFTWGDKNISAGPYKLEFCKNFLRELLEGQKKIQSDEEHKDVELIYVDEIHEIQRLWRMERGDWQNSAYRIYKEVIGIELSPKHEDLGHFGELEEKILDEVCLENKVPKQLVSKLIFAEFSSQGMTRHTKIYDKIHKVLSEEWRENLDEIEKDLRKRKKIKSDIEE